MFDIGWGELVVIGIVALIAIGPKELPTVMRTIGKWMGKVRRMASEFQGQFQEALQEAELADLKKHAEDLNKAVTDATNLDSLTTIENKPESTQPDGEPLNIEADAAGKNQPAAPEPAVATETSAASEPENLPAIEVPTPEPPVPVTEKDFAPGEPPPKQVGGKA
jgi:sec-independent protein translocase protein TatB